MFHLPIWITVASFLSLLAPLIRSIRPVVARELLLKYSIRLNKYEYRLDLPPQCPSNTDIFQSAAGVSRTMYDVDFKRYQGEWLSFATNDPTIPKGGICLCDRFAWTYIEKERSFKSILDIKCSHLGTFQMDLHGETNVTGLPGTIIEGSHSFGADFIPGYVLWIDEEYDSTIRYFCKEDYLGVPVFSSLQIWTREPIERNSDEGRRLLGTAHRVLPIPFDEKYMEFADHSDCDGLPC